MSADNSHHALINRETFEIGQLDSDGTDQIMDPLENIQPNPEVSSLLEAVTQWVETDPDGELRSIQISDRPEVTCQVLILRRLPPEASWQTLAAEFNLPISILSSFYQYHCLPCLRKFAESRGY